VATRCHILKLKCTKFNFSWSSDPARRAYSTPIDSLAGFNRAYFSEGRERTRGERRGKRKGEDHTSYISKSL